MHRLWVTLSAYSRTSNAIAQRYELMTRYGVMVRMILCRLLFGINDSTYAAYDMQRRSWRECSEYLGKRQLEALERAVNQGPKHHMDDKIAFHDKAVSAGVPTPRILAILNFDQVSVETRVAVPQIRDRAELAGFLASVKGKRIVLKQATGSYGRGMLSLKVGEDLRDHHDRVMTVDDVIHHFRTASADDADRMRHLQTARCYIVQEHLRTHPNLQPVMPGLALGTFRLVTYLDKKGEPSIPFAFAKLARVGSLNDNFQHGSSGNFLCGIELDSGRLMDAWGKKSPDAIAIERFEKHPDTGVRFKEFVVKQWDDLRAAGLSAARAFPEFRTVGWDVASTEDGIYVVEGNWRYDPDGPQFTLDRGIKAEVRKLFLT